jgi:hypothetical protein
VPGTDVVAHVIGVDWLTDCVETLTGGELIAPIDRDVELEIPIVETTVVESGELLVEGGEGIGTVVSKAPDTIGAAKVKAAVAVGL